MKMHRMKIRITFTEGILGTACADPEVHREYIASKAPDAPSIEEEVAAIGTDAMMEKGKTIFPKDENGNPFAWDYMLKGFFKDACGSLREITGSKCSKITSYKKKIDGLVFVSPRKIPYEVNGKIEEIQRPLRGQTARGERVALATSEQIPAGSTLTLYIELLQKSLRDAIIEMLDYGSLRGLGQWRNSGKGRFTYEILEETEGAED